MYMYIYTYLYIHIQLAYPGKLPFAKLGDALQVIVHEICTKAPPDVCVASDHRASPALRKVCIYIYMIYICTGVFVRQVCVYMYITYLHVCMYCL